MTQRVARQRFWPAELVALGIAFGGGIGLIILAVTAPFYSSSSSEQSSTGALVTHASSSATLVEENGAAVLVIVAAPLVITLAIFAILWIRSVGRGPGPLAWTIVGLLAALTLAGMLTVGPVILPTTTCLVTACTLRQARRPVA